MGRAAAGALGYGYGGGWVNCGAQSAAVVACVGGIRNTTRLLALGQDGGCAQSVR